MPDEKKPTILQVQQKTKPEIDGFITEHLDGGLKANAQEFVAWLRANKMPPRWDGRINTWRSVCIGKPICTIQISVFHMTGGHRGFFDDRPGRPPCWVIRPRLDNRESYIKSIMEEGLQDLVWDNAMHCVYSEKTATPGLGCSPGKPCAPGRDATVLGKTVTNVCCGHFLLQLWNPDDITLKNVKRLLELELKARFEKPKNT